MTPLTPAQRQEMQKLINEVLAGYVALWMTGEDEPEDRRPQAKQVREYIRSLEAEVERLQEGLLKGIELIVSEYCSHVTKCGEDNPDCYAQAMYAALSPSTSE